MSDTKKSKADSGTLKLKAPQNIVLSKTVEDGSIKQSLSHGRSKNVVVERRRKKLFRSQEESKEGKAWSPTPARSAVAASVEKRPAGSSNRSKRQTVLKPMSAEERKAYIEEQKLAAKAEVARIAQERKEAKEREKAEALAAEKGEKEKQGAALLA
ncbi:MAG: translation initiation factor IF-2 associated domain-containing protein [Magnetococcales bacterium]|nr:translation initiation factor IF-2 associated domain-containing protein [Magnetococcales bacterium]